jgi:hypothetical protein
MGCFSFLCKNSGEAVASSSYDGDAVRIYLLKGGKVIEEMGGFYDSYGRVFSDNECQDSFEWDMDWGDVVDLIYNSNSEDGLAVVLECYANGIIPTEQSEDDRDQGWGPKNGQGAVILEPYHKVY